MPQAADIIRNPVKRDGVSQSQRRMNALDPAFVKVDERTVADFLVFALKFSRQVNYYTETNIIDGNWEVFWKCDPTVITAVIEKVNPLLLKEKCETLFTQIPSVAGVQQLIETLLEIARNIDDWLKNLPTGAGLRIALRRLIQANLSTLLPRLVAYEKGAVQIFENYPSLDPERYKSFSSNWNLSAADLGDIEADKSLFDVPIEFNPDNPEECPEPSTQERLNVAFSRLKKLFTQAYNILFQIIQIAPTHFEESLRRKNHEPHLALFIAFLMLYKEVQDDLNQMTERHLDFFYKEVLQLKLKKSVPDKVHLFFELAKQVEEHELKQNIRFLAGKDVEGEDLFYSLDQDIVLNTAKITDIRTIFAEPKNTLLTDNQTIRNLFIASIANSSDGQGGEFEAEAIPAWAPFGSTKMPKAELGFAIASRELLLSEGTRTIKLKLFSNTLPVTITGNDFKIYLSGEEEWLEVTNITATKTTDHLLISYSLPIDFPAIFPFNSEVFEEDLGTSQPVMKVLLQQKAVGDTYAYERLKHFKIKKIVLEVLANGLENLLGFNDQGAIDPSKPFLPFGTAPKVGSSFYIGNVEAFQKSLDSVTLTMDWEQVPKSFSKHYRGYEEINSLTAASFTVDISVQKNGQETSVTAGKALFSAFDSNGPDYQNLKGHQIQIKPASTKLANLFDSKKIESYGEDSKDGFLRLDLKRDFEHDQFQNVLTRQMLAASQLPALVNGAYYLNSSGSVFKQPPTPSSGTNEIIIPKEPYTPIIKSIKLNYTSIVNTEDLVKNDDLQFFHLHPFHSTYEHFEQAQGQSLLPQFDKTEQEEGALFIGIQDLKARQSLTLLFQVAENTADAELPKAEIKWSYLSDNQWVEFKEFEVTSDTTDGFITSGIVTFTIPDHINKENTILPKTLHWLKASVVANSGAVCEMLNVHAQAARITFQDNNNAVSHLEKPLPPQTIADLEEADSAVDSITQEYPSFGGRTAEDPLTFYTRVSEWLRHKGRAITLFDYERLVLEAFPNIYKVKCINHSNEKHELRPGHVLMSVIPDFTKLTAVDRKQPKVTLSQLEKITAYLEARNTNFVGRALNSLHVLNPLYEKVALDFKVRFKPEITAIEFHKLKLKSAITRFLSPWAFDDGAEINFGGKVFKSSILHFVEKQEYVEYVTEFKLFHDGGLIDVNEIEARTPRSILIPADEQELKIQHIPTDDYCPAEHVIEKQELGYLVIGDS